MNKVMLIVVSDEAPYFYRFIGEVSDEVHCTLEVINGLHPQICSFLLCGDCAHFSEIPDKLKNIGLKLDVGRYAMDGYEIFICNTGHRQ